MNTDPYVKWLKRIALVLAAAGSVACGGGSSSTGESPPVITAEIAAGVHVVPAAVLSAPQTTLDSGEGGGLLLSSDSAELQGLKPGTVVFVPDAANKGLPFSFVGKVVSNVSTDGRSTVKLVPANVEDAYSSLDWDIDTALTGASVVGVIAPKNATVSFSSRPAPVNQAGLVITDSLTLAGNALSGEIKLSHEFEYQGKTVELFAEVDLSSVTVRSKGSYDIKNFASAGGWGEFTAVVKGDLGAKVGLRAPDLVEIPTLADLLTSQKIWNKLKWEGSDKFSLEGLDGDDKKGRFPLGGVVLAPCPAGICPVKFKGTPPNELIRAASVGTAVLWVYMDMSGRISVSGETGLRARGYHFEQGYEFKAVKNDLVATRIDVATPSAVEIYGNAKMEVTQRLGISVAADILVAGIRPASVNTFIGGQVEGKLEGDIAYAIRPPNGWSGYGCVDNKLWAGVELDANFRLKAVVPEKTVDLKIIELKIKEIGGTVERQLSQRLVDFIDKDLGSSCIASGAFAITAAARSVDPANADYALVDIDFTEAYNNVNVRTLTEKWLLLADCVDCTQLKFEMPSHKGGLDVVSLPVGHDYTLTLQSKLGDWIIKEASTTLSVGNKPTASFDYALNGSNCASLRLNATASATSSRAIENYAWNVRRTGSNVQSYSGNPVGSVMLPSCGETDITLTVTDSAGFVTAVSRTIDTTAIAPRITSVTPATAELDQATAFTVTGQNLPLTAIMAIADAECQTPVNRSATGFQQTCTPRAAGSKTASVATNTSANGGTVIDSTRSIAVMGPVAATDKLPHSGITASQCYSAGSNALGLCNGAGPVALNSQQDGHRANINAMSYGKVGFNGEPLADSASSWCAVKDKVTGLVWQNHQSTPAGYTNYGDNRAGDASKYAADNATLCGLSGWRLPTVDELQTIVDYGRTGPAIDTTWFPNTPGSWYWSSSPYVGNSYVAWVVYFNNGYVHDNGRGYGVLVRLVRASQ